MGSKPRKPFAGVGRPASPLDDLGKFIAKSGGKRLKKIEIQMMKRTARDIGWAKSYERAGLEKVVKKKLGRATGLNSWKDQTRRVSPNPNKAVKLKKTPENALAMHKQRMYYSKQDQSARLYGDSNGPHERYFKDMDEGRANRKQFNKMANKAFNDEIEIGRKQGARGNRQTKRVLSPKTKRGKK